MGNFFKAIMLGCKVIMSRPADLKKFFRPTVGRGQTVWPRNRSDQERYGFRFDYDGVITLDDGKSYHKFQVQPNAGKIVSAIRQWRENNGGTHGVISVVYIPVDQDPDPEVFIEATRSSLERQGYH